jgi:hypothetical protein
VFRKTQLGLRRSGGEFSQQRIELGIIEMKQIGGVGEGDGALAV